MFFDSEKPEGMNIFNIVLIGDGREPQRQCALMAKDHFDAVVEALLYTLPSEELGEVLAIRVQGQTDMEAEVKALAEKEGLDLDKAMDRSEKARNDFYQLAQKRLSGAEEEKWEVLKGDRLDDVMKVYSAHKNDIKAFDVTVHTKGETTVQVRAKCPEEAARVAALMAYPIHINKGDDVINVQEEGDAEQVSFSHADVLPLKADPGGKMGLAKFLGRGRRQRPLTMLDAHGAVACLDTEMPVRLEKAFIKE